MHQRHKRDVLIGLAVAAVLAVVLVVWGVHERIGAGDKNPPAGPTPTGTATPWTPPQDLETAPPQPTTHGDPGGTTTAPVRATVGHPALLPNGSRVTLTGYGQHQGGGLDATLVYETPSQSEGAAGIASVVLESGTVPVAGLQINTTTAPRGAGITSTTNVTFPGSTMPATGVVVITFYDATIPPVSISIS